MNNMRAIGRLMTEREFEELGLPSYYTRVFSDSTSKKTLTLKPLSRFPEKFKTVDRVLCRVERLGNELNYKSIEEIIEQVEDRIVVFKPVEGNYDVIAYDQCLLPRINNPISLEDDYVGVPCIDLDKLNISQNEFEDIVNGKLKTLHVSPAVSSDEEDKPEFIVVKSKNNTTKENALFIYFNISNYIAKEDGIVLVIKEPEKSKTVFNTDDIWNLIDDIDDSVMFIPKNIFDSYKNKLNTIMPEIIKEKIVSTVSKGEKLISTEVIGTEKNDFFIKIKNAAMKRHLVYSDDDIINFYVSSKASNFIVLAGMSGTGKSKLVKVYADALELNKYNGIKFISVSPAWTDDSDLLGYVDYKNMLYREADTGLLTFLKEASEHRDRKYIVCFDEMNLARVEHYFSQFLSIIEDSEKERTLTVYNQNLEDKLYNSSTYPANIKIWDNVLFVGTVNIDESTFNFSDKVLDRANIIKLSMRPFIELKGVIEDCKLTEAELSCLTELHNLIHDLNPKLGIGYRIVKQIDSYIKNLPEESSYSRNIAFDKLLVQRVITKLRGSEDQLFSLIGQLDENGVLSNSNMLDLLHKYSDISNFEYVEKELRSKAKELMLYGYSV